MAAPPVSAPRLRAVLFDAYGTLFDVYSVANLAEQLFPGKGERLAQVWRDKQIEYTRIVTMSSAGAEHYRPFRQVTRDALRWSMARLALLRDGDADGDAERRLMDQYDHLSPFPENREVLAELQRRGVTAGILSNGDPEMLDAAVRSAGFAEVLTGPLLSVHGVRRFKTDPAAYALGPATLGVPARDIVFVSSNAWDAIAATWFGYTTLWVNRAGAPPEQLGTSPTYTGTSLRDVLELLPGPGAA